MLTKHDKRFTERHYALSGKQREASPMLHGQGEAVQQESVQFEQQPVTCRQEAA